MSSKKLLKMFSCGYQTRVTSNQHVRSWTSRLSEPTGSD